MPAPLVALVTGAAQGLGEAIARRLAADGAQVVLADIDVDAARAVAAGMQGAEAAHVDVRSVAQLQALIAEVHAERGGLHVLVNNAAVTDNTALSEIDEPGWDAVIDTNLRSTFFACQAAAPLMREQGWGRIVNLASLAGQQGGLVAGAHYAASKAGIVVLTKIFARDLAGDGVTVNAVAPAAIDGPMMRRLPPERVDAIGASIPVGRIGTPHEVAAAVAYLCSDDAAFVTGTTVDVNGGLSMR